LFRVHVSSFAPPYCRCVSAQNDNDDVDDNDDDYNGDKFTT